MTPQRLHQHKRATVVIEVPFHDVDSLGVVWHGHYFKYLELARTCFFRKIGFDVPQMHRSGYVWPVIEANCRYIAPLRYGMTFSVTARLEDWEHRIRFSYTIQEKGTSRLLSKGHTVQATVQAKTGRLLLATPQFLLKKLGVP